MITAALVVGWVAAWWAAPTNAWLVASLVAFLGGFILMNVFKEELPHDAHGGHFGWFVAGLTVYAELTLVVVAVEHGDEAARRERGDE